MKSHRDKLKEPAHHKREVVAPPMVEVKDPPPAAVEKPLTLEEILAELDALLSEYLRNSAYGESYRLKMDALRSAIKAAHK